MPENLSLNQDKDECSDNQRVQIYIIGYFLESYSILSKIDMTLFKNVTTKVLYSFTLAALKFNECSDNERVQRYIIGYFLESYSILSKIDMTPFKNVTTKVLYSFTFAALKFK